MEDYNFESVKFDFKQIGRCRISDAVKCLLLGGAIFVNCLVLVSLAYSPIAWLLSIVPASWKAVLWGVPFGLIDGIFSPGYVVLYLFDYNALSLLSSCVAYRVCFLWFCFVYLVAFLFVAIPNVIYGLARSSNRYRLSRKIKPLSDDTINKIREARVIKIFISSTFANLKDERDYLMQQVFPRINRKANARGVIVVPIDLRWGIPPEDANSENVIIKCLEAIDECSPFIIGLSGGRYGWVPEPDMFADNSQLFHSYPWIKQEIDMGKSITEIEMAYGALNKDADIYGAFFFKSGIFGNAWLTGIDDANSLSKSAILRRRILDNPRIKAYCFSSVKMLGRKVEEYVNQLVEEVFPNNWETGVSESDHIRPYSMNIVNSDIYVARKDIENQIYQYLENSAVSALMVSGQCGVGKTTTVIKVLESYKKRHACSYAHFYIGKDYFDELQDFVASAKSDESPSKDVIVWGLTGGLDAQFYPRFIQNIKSGRKSIFLIDEHNGMHFEYNCGPLDVHVRMPELGTAQRRRLVRRLLSRSNKHMYGQSLSELCEAPFAGNAFALKTAVEILISFGNIDNFNSLFGKVMAMQKPYDIAVLLTELYRDIYGVDYVNATFAYLHNKRGYIPDFTKVSKEIEDMFFLYDVDKVIVPFIVSFPGFEISGTKVHFVNRNFADYAAELAKTYNVELQ